MSDNIKKKKTQYIEDNLETLFKSGQDKKMMVNKKYSKNNKNVTELVQLSFRGNEQLIRFSQKKSAALKKERN